MEGYPGVNIAPFRDERHVAAETSQFSAELCFLLGLSVMVPIAPEARITLFDAVAAVLILQYWRAAAPFFRKTIIVLGVSLVAMAFSAYLNGSEVRAFFGRAYQPTALLAETMGYGILILGTSSRGRTALVLGAMAGICCHYFYPSDLRVYEEPIKFLLGIPLGVALLALLGLNTARNAISLSVTALLMISYAVFCFFAGSRSIGGVFFVSAVVVACVGFVRVPASYAKFAPLMIVAAGILGYSFTELYAFFAIKGFFGDRAASIALFQSSFGSILLGGRPEIIINLSGIRDAPLLGVGILNYPSLYIYEMINLSVYSRQSVLDLSNILYHSALFGTGFESGLIAAAIWGLFFYMAVFCVPLLNGLNPAHRSFVAPLLLATAWHILYSPPIPYNRFVMSVGLGFAFALAAEWRHERQTKERPTSSLPDPS